MALISTRHLPLAVILTGLAAAATWALWPSPIPVDIAPVSRGAMEVTLEDEGISRIRDVYTVSAPLIGKIKRPRLRVGDPVARAETIVASIEPVDPAFLDLRSLQVSDAAAEAARAAVDLAEAQLRQARAQAEFARTELQRTRQLAARQATTERALDQAQLNLATAEATLASASASLDLRRHELEQALAQRIQPGDQSSRRSACCIDIRAPADGRVLRLVVESEQVVQPGQALLEIGNPEDLEIAVDMVSRHAVRVPMSARARIENWGGEGALQARVIRIDPTAFTKVSALGIEEQRVKIVLELTESRERFTRLGHGFRVIVRVVVWQGEDVLTVPLGALFRHGDNWAVYALENDRAVRRIVQIGERSLREAQVLSGLAVNDRIVLHPSDRLSDGARISARVP